MTRILSELLGAREPAFHHGLKQLEQASGAPSEDIRLTTEIIHGMQDRLKQLRLDPRDTTGRELYGALMQRVREDAEIFRSLAGINEDHVHLTKAVEQFVSALPLHKEVFAMRSVAAKRLLRLHPPKKAMKKLGYRSLESLLKHETASLVLAAAHLTESAAWHRSMSTAYKRLSPSDFESRPLHIQAPDNDRWRALSEPYVIHAKQNIIGLRELGAIILLPLPASVFINGAPLAITLLTLQAANDIATASTYLKMHQVRPDFGDVVARISRNEPLTKAEVAGALLPWKTVHRYFARHTDAYNPALFEPHVHQDDLRWHAAEDVLADLHPRFAFWHGTSHLAAATKHGTVSLNLTDTLLSFCNMLPYEQRFVRYMREHVWHELMLRYMHQSGIERAVHEQLSGELIENTGTN